ncbi:hypothetical protein GCM10027456_77010 [Kineosporia babensis]
MLQQTLNPLVPYQAGRDIGLSVPLLQQILTFFTLGHEDPLTTLVLPDTGLTAQTHAIGAETRQPDIGSRLDARSRQRCRQGARKTTMYPAVMRDQAGRRSASVTLADTPTLNESNSFNNIHWRPRGRWRRGTRLRRRVV